MLHCRFINFIGLGLLGLFGLVGIVIADIFGDFSDGVVAITVPVVVSLTVSLINQFLIFGCKCSIF